jgi:hypothetical protein
MEDFKPGDFEEIRKQAVDLLDDDVEFCFVFVVRADGTDAAVSSAAVDDDDTARSRIRAIDAAQTAQERLEAIRARITDSQEFEKHRFH